MLNKDSQLLRQVARNSGILDDFLQNLVCVFLFVLYIFTCIAKKLLLFRVVKNE